MPRPGPVPLHCPIILLMTTMKPNQIKQKATTKKHRLCLVPKVLGFKILSTINKPHHRASLAGLNQQVGNKCACLEDFSGSKDRKLCKALQGLLQPGRGKQPTHRKKRWGQECGLALVLHLSAPEAPSWRSLLCGCGRPKVQAH